MKSGRFSSFVSRGIEASQSKGVGWPSRRGLPISLQVPYDRLHRDGDGGDWCVKMKNPRHKILLHSVGHYILPTWVIKILRPSGEVLIIRVAKEDMPIQFHGNPNEVLKPSNLIGGGTLKPESFFSMDTGSALTLDVIAWSFNLVSLGVGTFVFLYTIAYIFYDQNWSYIGAFVSVCAMGILLTILGTEIAAAALVAGLPWPSRLTYFPSRALFMGVIFFASFSGWTSLGIKVEHTDAIQL